MPVPERMGVFRNDERTVREADAVAVAEIGPCGRIGDGIALRDDGPGVRLSAAVRVAEVEVVGHGVARAPAGGARAEVHVRVVCGEKRVASKGADERIAVQGALREETGKIAVQQVAARVLAVEGRKRGGGGVYASGGGAGLVFRKPGVEAVRICRLQLGGKPLPSALEGNLGAGGLLVVFHQAHHGGVVLPRKAGVGVHVVQDGCGAVGPDGPVLRVLHHHAGLAPELVAVDGIAEAVGGKIDVDVDSPPAAGDGEVVDVVHGLRGDGSAPLVAADVEAGVEDAVGPDEIEALSPCLLGERIDGGVAFLARPAAVEYPVEADVPLHASVEPRLVFRASLEAQRSVCGGASPPERAGRGAAHERRKVQRAPGAHDDVGHGGLAPSVAPRDVRDRGAGEDEGLGRGVCRRGRNACGKRQPPADKSLHGHPSLTL